MLPKRSYECAESCECAAPSCAPNAEKSCRHRQSLFGAFGEIEMCIGYFCAGVRILVLCQLGPLARFARPFASSCPVLWRTSTTLRIFSRTVIPSLSVPWRHPQYNCISTRCAAIQNRGSTRSKDVSSSQNSLHIVTAYSNLSPLGLHFITVRIPPAPLCMRHLRRGLSDHCAIHLLCHSFTAQTVVKHICTKWILYSASINTSKYPAVTCQTRLRPS